MYKDLYSIIASLNGSVLAIGLDDKLITKINDNNEIIECDNLGYTKLETGKGNGKKAKKIVIRKIKKVYKKKKFDFIICNYEHISKFLNTFVDDSIYLCKGNIYFYGKLDKELLITKYQRYNTKIDSKDFKDTSIIDVDVRYAKHHFIKSKFYRLTDTINSFIEILGDILMG